LPSGSRDFGGSDELAEEFTERYRRGDRQSLFDSIDGTADALPSIAACRDVEPAHLKRALQGTSTGS
jgi:hypothetical protein